MIAEGDQIGVSASPGTGCLRAAFTCLGILALLGFASGLALLLTVPADVLRAAPVFVNLYLFAQHDTVWLGLASLGLFLVLATVGRRDVGLEDRLDRLRAMPSAVPLMAAATLVLGAAGVELVYHGYALSLDEFLARFQAKTLLGGHLLAPIGPEWAGMAEALQPLFMRNRLEHGLWAPGYQPVAAASIALFELAGLGKYGNVVLAAACLPILASLARRLWPAKGGAPALAAFLLASSPQFLITALTPYAMTAHLLAGLVWLWCFLRGGIAGHLGAAATGFVAVGLHQVHVHPFFVLPFMLSLLADRRLGLAAAYAAWYAGVLAFWIFWRDLATLSVAADGAGRAADGGVFLARAIAAFARHSIADLLFWIANAFRFIAWQNLILVPLLFVAVRHWRRAPRPVRLLGWAIVASMVPYVLFMPTQGHGWGYRYLHPLLGNFALLAVFGWLRLKAALEPGSLARARRVLAVLAAFSLLAGLPLRALQVERFLAPFAAASTHIAALPHEVVLVDDRDVWFAVDLVRNDPYLERGPKVLAVSQLSAAELAALCRRYRVAFVGFETLGRFGLALMPRPPDERAAAQAALSERLRTSGCLPS